MTAASNRSPVLDSLKAQSEGVTPQQQQAVAFFDLIATTAQRRGAKRVCINSGPQGELSVDIDFEGINGCDSCDGV